jgi:hypothetical protein
MYRITLVGTWPAYASFKQGLILCILVHKEQVVQDVKSPDDVGRTGHWVGHESRGGKWKIIFTLLIIL